MTSNAVAGCPHPSLAHRLGIPVAGALLALAAVMPGQLGVGAQAAVAFDSAGSESQLVGLINADRAQAGLAPLTVNPTLTGIAGGGDIQLCGTTIHGRARDMAERNYFSHQIPPCGSYVWPALDAAGVQYSSAGENIGWNNQSDPSVSVTQMNSDFMNSPGHRANILGDYNQVGVGAYAAPGSWGQGGASYSGVIVYAEIFVKGPLPMPQPPRMMPKPHAGSCGGATHLGSHTACLLRGAQPIAQPVRLTRRQSAHRPAARLRRGRRHL